VLKYDDVMNAQRKEVYAQRKEFMRADDVAETIADMREEIIATMVSRRVPEQAFSENWELTELAADVNRVFGLDLPIPAWGAEEGIDEVGLRERIQKSVDEMMAAKAANFGPDLLRFIEKSVLIQTMDAVWKEHLHALDHLRQGIGLRAYGQRDPLNEYKSEAFVLFNAMLDELKERVSSVLARVELAPEQPAIEQPAMMPFMESHPAAGSPYQFDNGEGGVDVLSDPIALSGMPPAEEVDPNDPTTWGSIGRNAQCPCGSGKKFKHCHGRLG